VHDVNLLDEISPEAGAFYVLDRGSLLSGYKANRFNWLE
jgi:hypothetical protein